jgi:hypothetical protein
MANFGSTGAVHKVRYDPRSGKNDVFFGPKGTKPGHAVVDGGTGRLEYLRGAGKGAKASKDTGRFFGRKK